MLSFDSDLKEFLTGFKKLIILGVGNELKSDDGVGPFIINKLIEENFEKDNVLLINSKTVPENYTGKIRKEQPSHVIIVDACLMGAQPGDIKIVDEKDFVNIGISTHSMSLSYFVKYLQKSMDFKIIFVGIEPETMDWGENPTLNVEKTAYDFINLLKGCVL